MVLRFDGVVGEDAGGDEEGCHCLVLRGERVWLVVGSGL